MNFGFNVSAFDKALRLAKAREREWLASCPTPILGRDFLSVGGLKYPLSPDGIRLLFVGERGVGRTLSIRKALNETLSQVRPGGKRRVLVFDSTGELLSDVKRSGTAYKVVQVDDQNSARLHFPKEFYFVNGNELGELLIPGEYPSFPEKIARYLIGKLHEAMRVGGDSWSLFEFLVTLLGDKQRLFQVMSRNSSSRTAFEDVFGKTYPFSSPSVTQVLESRLGDWRQLAMNWEYLPSGELFTLQEWAQGEYTLVIRQDPRAPRWVRHFNRVVLERAIPIVLTGASRDTWVVIDDLALLESLDPVSSLLQWGRSMGVNLITSCSSRSELEAKFGPKEIELPLGLFTDRAFLPSMVRSDDDWVQFLVRELYQVPLDALPKCDRQNGLHAYYSLSALGHFKNVVSWSDLVGTLPLAPGASPKVSLAHFDPSEFRWRSGMLAKYGVV